MFGYKPTGIGRYLLNSLTPANERHENPSPTLAVRPGISCSTEGCGSLVIVGSLANRNDRSVLFRHHVIPIDLPPFISRRNHTRRMSHTISTITIIVPTKPKPNISPPSGHIGHQRYPYSDDRPASGCRLIKTSQCHRSSKWNL